MSATLSAIMPWMSWWPTIGPPPWIRPAAQSVAVRSARSDHQALLDEPVPGQLVALADPAEHRVLPHADVLEAELRVLVDERVHVARDAPDGHAGGVLVDQEERRGPLGQHHRQHDHVVRGVAHRDEPL